MDLELSDKRAFVAGSSSGIGKAIAQQLLKEGASVVIHGIDAAETDSTLAELQAWGAVTAVNGDLTQTDEFLRVIDEANKDGEVDAVINCVGIFQPADFATIPDEVWQRYLDINVMTAVRLARTFLPVMLERGSGRLVNIASEAGLKPLPNMIHYSVTKTALLGLSRGLAELTKGTEVTVNSVLPGPTWTAAIESYMTSAAQAAGKQLQTYVQEYFKANEPTSLIQRFETPDEVATVVAYLVSPLASGINGASVRAEGGIVRSI